MHGPPPDLPKDSRALPAECRACVTYRLNDVATRHAVHIIFGHRTPDSADSTVRIAQFAYSTATG